MAKKKNSVNVNSVIAETNLIGTGDKVVLDLSLNTKFRLKLTRYTTLSEPINRKKTSIGSITIVQDSNFPMKLLFDPCYIFAGGLTPDLTNRVNAIDVLHFICKPDGRVECNLVKDLKE